MMTVPMDNSSVPSSRELAEQLYKKNIELESGLRKSAQSRIPSDPNIWSQIRENYEAIIIQDHDFSQKREVELALWQLHYRRIEEFRAHINAAKSAGSVAPQGEKKPGRPDRIEKIRAVFKSFLSESTGFYHDLILKIRGKFGLPLGFFSEATESQAILSKDEKKSAEMKKGLMSCHRCLIYLGDLARYKTSYGESDAVTRDYSAASSYYIQAASLCPSSGNPHHQLALLASYSGDDLVSLYRYFRSLAAEMPFPTARDNLIIAFEKNRQIFTQLPGKPSLVKAASATRANGRGRGRGNARVVSKDSKDEGSPPKERELDIPGVLKAFYIRFIRLNGVLFTRTSLETFADILSSAVKDLLDLLTSGHEEVLNFGNAAADNGLAIVRLIAILIFTVHNVNRETEGQSYAEVLQRTVLLQNAYTAAFEFAGHIIKRCTQLHNAESSFLLPAVLVFIEWLACHPNIAVVADADEKQSNARSFFWNQFVSLINKFISSGLVSVDGDENDTCFSDMSSYDEGETGNRIALWEDFELKGFLPLVPAQLILDFSRKHSSENDGSIKERKSRMERIFAAGKALMNVVQVDQKTIYLDVTHKKFVIGTKPVQDDYVHTSLPDELISVVADEINHIEGTFNHTLPNSVIVDQSFVQLKTDPYVGGEDDDEEIVFKPTIAERFPDGNVSMQTAYGPGQPAVVSAVNGAAVSSAFGNIQMPTVPRSTSAANFTVPNFSHQPSQQMQLNTSKWLTEQEAALASELMKFNINGNGMLVNHGLPNDFSDLQSSAYQTLHSGQSSYGTINPLTGRTVVADPVVRPTVNSTMPLGMVSNGFPSMFTTGLPTASRKSPVSRPVRHVGPPPGFSHVPSKHPESSITDSAAINGHWPQIDDYSWLDGYHPLSRGLGTESLTNLPGKSYISNDSTNVANGTIGFPFPGKQVASVQTPVTNEKWRDFQLFEHLKAYKDSLMPEQDMWSGH